MVDVNTVEENVAVDDVMNEVENEDAVAIDGLAYENETEINKTENEHGDPSLMEEVTCHDR